MSATYITRLYRVAARHLQVARPVGDGLHVWLNGYVPWKSVCLPAPARLETTEDTEGRTRRYLTTLSYLQPSRTATEREPQAYLAETANGERWLIGLARPPYLLVQQQSVHPDRPGERSACQVTASWTSSCGPLLVI